MLNDSCSKAIIAKAPQTCATGGAEQNSNSVREAANEISKGAFFSMLGSERAKNDTCAEHFIVEQIQNEKSFSNYSAKMQLKAQWMAVEIRNVIILQNRLGQNLKTQKNLRKWNETEVEEFKKEIRESSSRMAAIENSIPLSDLESVRRLLKESIQKSLANFSTMGSMNSALPEAVIPINPDEFKSDLKKALASGRAEIQSDIKVLNDGSAIGGKGFDRATKESLAQDHDLTQSLYEHNISFRASVSKVSCEVEKEYGEGAKARDDLIMKTSIAASVFSLGWGAIAEGAVSGVSLLGTPARILASRGILSLRTSRIIASGANVLALSMNSVGSINNIDKCFQNNSRTHIQVNENSQKTCENFSASSVEQEDCVLALALNGLGFIASSPASQKFIATALAKVLPRSSIAISENAGPASGWSVGDKVRVPRSSGAVSYGSVREVRADGKLRVNILDESGRYVGFKDVLSSELSSVHSILPRGKVEYDRFANAFNTNNFDTDLRFVSVMINGERLPARVISSDGQSLAVEILDGGAILRRSLSGDDLLKVRLSESARDVFANSQILSGVVSRNVDAKLSSRKISDYTSRGGEIVRVDPTSPALRRVVAAAETTIANEIPDIVAGQIQTISQKEKLAHAWLVKVVPQIESQGRGDAYAVGRNQIIRQGNGSGDLGVIAERGQAVCRELTMCASVVFSEYGIRSRVVTGNIVGEGGHAWLEVLNESGQVDFILDSNYVRSTFRNFDDYSRAVGGAKELKKTIIVEPSSGAFFEYRKSRRKTASVERNLIKTNEIEA